MRIGVDIMQPDPRSEIAQFPRQIGHMGANLPSVQHRTRMPDIDTIGRGILTDHQQFPGACRNQLFRLPDHRIGRTADQIAPDARDDAELAAVVAALRYLQIAVMARRQLQPGLRHQIEIGGRDRRCGGVDGGDHGLILLRPAYGEHGRVRRPDHIGLMAKAARNNDAAIFGNRLANRRQTFGLG